jgi:hypothetical protein
MQCTQCDCKQLLRLRRTGFLEIRVFPIFGFYPWKCPKCRAKQLLHGRGKKRRKLIPQPSLEQ